MTELLHVLIIEDSEDDFIVLKRHIQKAGLQCDFQRVETESGFCEALRETQWDFILSDFSLPQFSGTEAIKIFHDFYLDIPFIIISRAVGEETAVEVMKAGANDFIMKDHLHRLVPAIQRELKDCRNRRQLLQDKFNLENQLRNAVQDGMVVIDTNGAIEDINIAALTFFDVSFETARSSSLQEICKDWMTGILIWLEQCIQTRETVSNCKIENTGGSIDRTYEISFTPLVTSQKTQVLLLIRDISRLHTYEKEIAEKEGLGRIIGKSKPMLRVYEIIKALADTDTTVLINGPSGTGKELVCEAIHEYSVRKNKPFVKINCAALPENLLESELFGHVKGAFTNAVKDKIGKFELANGGSIFLDEIGDISHALQLRLLRVLQERELERVGSNKTIQIDVRVVAATNKNLMELIQQGKFREDLYYRLNVMTISLPPLCDRHGDISLLIRHFLQLFYARMRKPIKGIDPEAMKALLQYHWPGNIRQLENAIERSVVLCRDGYIKIEDLPSEILQPGPKVPIPTFSLPIPVGDTPVSLVSIDKDLLVETLASVGWNRIKAAEKLNVHRNTISRWIKLHQLVK